MRITDELINACSKGRHRSQVELYRLCYPVLMPVCQRYAVDDAEASEQLNIGFYRILKSLETYEFGNEQGFLSWSRRILINTLIDAHRSSKRYREVHVATDQATLNGVQTDNILNEAALKMDAQHILRLIDKLPVQQKTVFQLFAIDAYSHREIAEMLELSEATSRWYLAKARKSLQQKLKVFMKKGHPKLI